MRPIVLAIAGSDSSAGAGIQADLKSIEANGGYGATVITAVTAQNTRGVSGATPLDARLVRAQLEAVLTDLDVAALKTGMLAEASVIRVVAATLRQEARRPPLVCDPVLRSKGGHPLLAADALAVLRDELLPLATLVTPNVAEAEALSGQRIRTLADAARAAASIRERGARAVLVTGGHLADAPATDLLVGEDGRARSFPGEALGVRHTHGTGCTFSAAIATRLACGDALEPAIERAKRFVTEAIRHGLPLGAGIGPTDPFFFLHERETDDAPWERRRS